MTKVCIVGCGAIGSLYAAHLSRVAEVYAFVRRPEQAGIINREGIRVSGTHQFQSHLEATTEPEALPQCDIGIVACKATQTERAFAPVGGCFNGGVVVSAQNGLGCEEIMSRLTAGQIIRATTFMSGTRHSDSHVEYELDTATWMGPFEPSNTPFYSVVGVAELLREAGLKAEALEDARPAQWSKLIFNASVNSVSALTSLPHSPHFSDEGSFASLGHLLHDLIDEGVEVARALGIELHEDPWEMNRIGSRTNHPTSMLADVRKQVPTEVHFLGGAIARQAAEAGIPAPLHSALYRLIRGKQESWSF